MDSLSYILDTFETACLITDAEYVITHWNNTARDLTGFTRDDVIGKTCSQTPLKHMDEAGRCLCNSRKCPLCMSVEGKTCCEAYVRINTNYDSQVAIRIKSCPIFDNQGVISGCIQFFWELSSDADLSSMKLLEHMAYKDQLTGVPNRNYVMSKLQKLKANHLLHDYIVALLDIDHFKSVNDTHGHLAGDQVLKSVAHCITHNIRPSDIFGRWGGEEFILLTPKCDVEDAAQFCDRLRCAVSSHVYHQGNTSISVTISIGLYQPKPEDSIEVVLGKTDLNLYRAKGAGRDCVVTWAS